jgi:formylglycine-generating enzyme required for sulfatase activity
VPTPTAPPAVKVVPKGLRAFEAEDADFFLELLPGPRDRDGLPESIRFWKTRIETVDPEGTFAVGLLYGPSGCGKSSLVKAGLLPRLAKQITAVYAEATAGETEARLLKGLRRQLADLPGNLGLVESLTALRQGRFPAAGRKVLLVLDQFEQWLHARHGEEGTELVQALRQCDGGRVQAVVLVRDDFWLAVSRFMDALEAELVQGRNMALVDLFDARHARKVLAAFGRAFGALPERPDALGKEQETFLEQAVAGLSQDGKVVSVRLAVFAEMVKGRLWTPAALKQVGGTAGVGVTFLEETFSSPGANPRHRLHQKAARAVLKALLPESGTDIRGHMRSHAELLAASGYAGRPKDFSDLLRILDEEIRLLTPTDPEGVLSEPEALATGGAAPNPVADAPGSHPVANASGSAGSPARYYQLSHDYLVPSLRDWLTRKQRETWRGRAELRLAERAALWNARPERRHLPAWWEWLDIRLLTRTRDWTTPQQKMMRRAGRFHGLRAAALLVLLLLLGWGGYEGYGAVRAEHLVTADTADVPRLIAQQPPYCGGANWLRRRHLQNSPEDSKEHLHASLALAPGDGSQVEYLSGRLLRARPAELPVIRDVLWPYRDGLKEKLWAVLEDRNGDPDQRLHAACALARYAPDDPPRWEKVGGDVAARLVTENALVLGPWVDALRPVRGVLLPPLATFLEDEKRSADQRRTIAGVYGTYAADSPEAFAQLEKRLAAESEPGAPEDAKLDLARRQANLGVALLLMDRGEQVWPLLKHSPDPTRRSYLIDRLGSGGVAAPALGDRLDGQTEVSIRRALLLALAEFDRERLTPKEQERLDSRLVALYRDDPDPGVHGAAGWLLRRWGQQEKVAAMDQASRERQRPEGRRWYVNGQGQTMVLVPAGEFDMGAGPERKRVRIDHSFALAARDVTVAEFRRFREKHEYAKDYAPTEDCPVNMVSWYDAAAYCNWLSAQEGIPEDQWYYPKDIGLAGTSLGPVHLLLETLGAQGLAPAGAPMGGLARGVAALGVMESDALTLGHNLRMPKDYRQRTGYRLPTEAEWEYACRAGTVTPWSMGAAEDLLPKYGWFYANSSSRSHPVGSLRPNDLGLFDMHGNVWQWCQDRWADDDKGQPQDPGDKSRIDDKVDVSSSRLLRGGAVYTYAVIVRSAVRVRHAPANRNYIIGFRPARTYR